MICVSVELRVILLNLHLISIIVILSGLLMNQIMLIWKEYFVTSSSVKVSTYTCFFPFPLQAINLTIFYWTQITHPPSLPLVSGVTSLFFLLIRFTLISGNDCFIKGLMPDATNIPKAERLSGCLLVYLYVCSCF